MADSCASTKGALVASVAVTALQLDLISQAQWVVRALWVSSLVSGLLVVYYASVQRRTIGRLLRPQQLRDWISVKKDIVLGDAGLGAIISFSSIITTLLSTSIGFVPQEADFPPDEFGCRDLPSLSSVILISSPRLALSYSVNSFVIGLGVYLGCIWRRGLDKEGGIHDSRNVFIVYMAVIIICYFFFLQVYLVHAKQESFAKQDKILARLMELREVTLRTAGCSTSSKYRQWRQGPRRGPTNERGDTDVENFHGSGQSTKVTATTKSEHASVNEEQPNDPITLSTGSQKDQEPETLAAVLRQSAQLAREQARIQILLSQRYEELALKSAT